MGGGYVFSPKVSKEEEGEEMRSAAVPLSSYTHPCRHIKLQGKPSCIPTQPLFLYLLPFTLSALTLIVQH